MAFKDVMMKLYPRLQVAKNMYVMTIYTRVESKCYTSKPFGFEGKTDSLNSVQLLLWGWVILVQGKSLEKLQGKQIRYVWKTNLWKSILIKCVQSVVFHRKIELREGVPSFLDIFLCV